MKLNYEVLKKILSDLAHTDEVTDKCKEDIEMFVKNDNLAMISPESANELKAGIFTLVIKPRYEFLTNEFLPNIFVREDIEYGY